MNLLKSEREVFKLNEVVAFLGISRVTALKLIKNNELHAFKAGGNYFITKKALFDFIKLDY